MQIKAYLNDDPEDVFSAPYQKILENRGIPIDMQDKWLYANKKDDFIPWTYLENIDKICKIVHRHIEENHKICVLVDCDVDGYTSAAIFLSYIRRIASPTYDFLHNVIPMMQDGKHHGLGDGVANSIIDNLKNEPIKLVVCFDSSSNDIEEHGLLHTHGVEVVCGDHHDCSIPNYVLSPATIANVQCCDYPNKSLTGAGVAYKFCQAYDDIYGFCFADDYLDLAALGNIGDMADYRDFEIRAIVNEGLSHIYNPLLNSMIKS